MSTTMRAIFGLVAALIDLIAVFVSARIAAVVYERAILQTGGRLHVRQVLRGERSPPTSAS